jgi:RNA polymerase sigma-B factor
MPGKSQSTRERRQERLLRRFEEDGSDLARERVIGEFLPLARGLAGRYGGIEPREDLVQVACVGLVKAVDRFDPSRGNAFSSYAIPTILGELRRHFRDRGWSIRPPRDVQELVLKVEKAQGDLPARLGRTPTAGDIASSLKISEEDVLEAMHASQGHYCQSLDAPAPGDDEAPSWSERVGEEDERYELADSVIAIRPELRAIPQRDREILCLRFKEDLTQSEIAARVGLSQMHVSRILRQTIERLRRAVEEDADGEDVGLALAS